MGFDRILDVLNKIRAQNPTLTKRIKEAEALSRWEKAVGPAIAKHSRAIRVQDAVLWVEVDHPIWKSELHHRKRQILSILNGSSLPPPQSGKGPAKAFEPPSEALTDILLLDPRPGLQKSREE